MDRGTGLVENTPKAFANFSPGFEEREPWVWNQISRSTLKGFANRGTLSGFRTLLVLIPGLSQAPTLML